MTTRSITRMSRLLGALAAAIISINTVHAEPLRYVANLSQYQDNAPVAVVLENTLGGELVWTRLNAGVYKGQLAGAFPDASRIFWPNTVTIYDDGMVKGTITIQWQDANSIYLTCYDLSGSDTADGILEYFQPYRLELRVYPAETNYMKGR